jgi:hypothetical protein
MKSRGESDAILGQLKLPICSGLNFAELDDSMNGCRCFTHLILSEGSYIVEYCLRTLVP